MLFILQNNNLEIHIDHPLEGYRFSRFDWTGKIKAVKFNGKSLTILETTDEVNENDFGQGFYNEFGIETALGFDDTPIGGWFHKIGIGLLKKEDNEYLFHKNYEIRPAKFETKMTNNRLITKCISEEVNGYEYQLIKEIELLESGFAIKYQLENTGDMEIETDEYVHNFVAIDQILMGPDYILKFPFPLKPGLTGAVVNPEQKVIIKQNEVNFNGIPNEQFFFGQLSGNEEVVSGWELINKKSKTGIRETGNFQTNKINLWGWRHVISPELFCRISIKPGQSMKWSRNYEVFRY